MTMRRRYPLGRHKLVWFVAIPILLLAGHLAYWRIAAERLRSGYEAWLAARQAEGWEMISGSPSIGGWPRAATVAVPALTFRHAGPAVPGDLQASSASIMLSVSLFRPATLMIYLTGATRVRIAGQPEVILDGQDDWLSVPLRQSGSHSIDLHVSDLLIQPASGTWHASAGLLNAQAMVADRVGTGEADAQLPAATFTVSAEAIELPTVVKWPLGANISSLSVEGLMNGPFPPSRDITGWAEAWRDGGGSLAITHLTMGWGPLGLTSSATLALDEQLQPMGSGNGRIIGYAATLDRLAAAGMLTKSAATAAKAVLSLMAGTPDADEPSAVEVPLTLQYRTLSMRQVPLVRLPELDWPARSW